MSAGICILNKNAIAMAADSAVTIGNHIAIHNSANKLFALSRVAPVGVIIYANGLFMDVPFEIIIKEFKNRIGNTTFPSLKEYLDSLIIFIEANALLFHFPLNENKYVQSVFLEFASGLLGDYSRAIKQRQEMQNEKLNDSEINIIVQDVVDATIEFIKKQEIIEGMAFAGYVKEKYYKTFLGLLSNPNFSWLSNSQKELICEHACSLFDSKFDRNNYVGIAIAGYGDKEIYPSLFHIHLCGFIDGKTRFFVYEKVVISENSNASIVPLAQVDVMQTFLFGINDQFLGYLANDIPKQIKESISNMDDSLFASNKKAIVLGQLTGVTNSILKHMQETALKNYMSPILESVSTLPIEELGLLAESMINITSIRRKVALDNNVGTVGGPIDVSIISKGDGFIWLKRKHYFDRQYNPQYFYSHYGDGGLKEGIQNE